MVRRLLARFDAARHSSGDGVRFSASLRRGAEMQDLALLGLGSHATGYAPWRGVLDFSRLPRQGALGDCWVMAPMLAVHRASPGFFSTSIRYVPGESTAEVRVFRRGRPVWRRITMEFPVKDNGDFVYATEAGAGPGWPALIERAVAEEFAASYRFIATGFSTFGFPALTGVRAALRVPLPSLAHIADARASGRAVTLSTHPLSPTVSGALRDRNRTRVRIPPMHVFALDSVDEGRGVLLVRNPWDPGRLLEIEHARARLAFISADILGAPLTPA